MREARAALDAEQRASAAAAVTAGLAGVELLRTAETIAGYRAIRGEVDIDEALLRLIDRGATVTVPRVVGDDLEFVEWLPTTSAGQRLGQGGGFYDRSLARLGDPGPVVIGIAHSFQEVARIPAEPWDIPLDAVVTDTRIAAFRPGVLQRSISANRPPQE